MAEFNLLKNHHLCTLKQTSDLGEIGANFFYSFHREHSLLKLIIRKLSPKIDFLAKTPGFIACEQQGAESDKRSLISAFVVRLLESIIDLLQVKFKYSS